ncbi:MAG: putative LPS assembly protein LptD, partial [Proteobacteria bacterium]|nr:putative LPS assembly protein LptD [Pseudomonadota bacterium]
MQKIKSQQYLSKKILWSNLLISCFLVSNLFGQTIPPEQDTRKTPNEQVDNPATQQNSTTPDESSGFQPLINAKSIGLSKDGTQQIFDGDVIAIGPRSLVTADKIIWDQKNKKIIAEGHVIGLSNGQYITGDKIELWTESGDAKVQNAILVVNDGGEAEKISKEILGYSISEIEFEAHRKERIDEIELKKKDLKLEARTTTKSGKELSPEIIRDYARFLEQSDLIARQENPAFAQMTEDRRQTLKRRRNFWDQARLSETLNQRVGNTSYFKLKGDFLERTNGNDLNAKNGLWTPCHCENDESPPWALRSSNIFAQPGGYATFNHAILEIKGIPVLYLPWARLPIKGVRQSGFLPPSISSDSQSGNVYSQPLFLDLGENKDVTLKTDFFEKRGTKFGFEGRYQRRQYSGFQLNLEMMRDRVWMEKRGNRVELYNLYSQGLEAARQDKSGDDISKVGNYTYRDFAVRRVAQAQYWQETEYKDCLLEDPNLRRSCEAKLFGRLRPPGNSTRGMLKWSGHERISDRISFSSSGELYSDRQYSADLYTPESFQAGFDTGSGERALQPIRAQINYDQSNYYIGLGSGVSDYVKYNDNFEGYQLPAYLKLKSRWFTLNDTLLPIYFGAGLDQLRIARVQGNKIDPEEQSDYLPPAWWRRAT